MTNPTPPRGASSIAALIGIALVGTLLWNVLSPAFPEETRTALARPPVGAPPQGGDAGTGPRGTVFDRATDDVDRLDPDLLVALRRMAAAARQDGVTFTVNSGWRTPEHQEELLREAVTTYGSAEEAARWVATPETSPHVSGDAVDLGPTSATSWLARHGAAYGLCQIYANEPWHYELRPDAARVGCPEMYADPTHDPRMQR